jgi:hypothetical protein
MEKEFETKEMTVHFTSVEVSNSTIMSLFKEFDMIPEKIKKSLDDNIGYEFKIPEELTHCLELINVEIFNLDVYRVEAEYVCFDLSITFKFKFKTKKEEAIESIKIYQSNNDDLRADVDIFWKTVDNKKLLFDTWWEEDRREDIERSNWFDNDY